MREIDAFSAFHPALLLLYYVLVLAAAMCLTHPLCLAVSLLGAVVYAVVAYWDKLDANRERKERYHEPIRGDMTLENGLKYNGRIFPEWMCSANYTSVRQGRYLDVIFNCPHELGEMTGHPILSKTFQELDAEYKSLLYFMVVRDWTPQTYAAALNQTDRNVRKKMTRLMNRIQKELYTELSGKSNLSLREKEFLAEYEKAALADGEKERCTA